MFDPLLADKEVGAASHSFTEADFEEPTGNGRPVSDFRRTKWFGDVCLNPFQRFNDHRILDGKGCRRLAGDDIAGRNEDPLSHSFGPIHQGFQKGCRLAADLNIVSGNAGKLRMRMVANQRIVIHAKDGNLVRHRQSQLLTDLVTIQVV
jgi:hypothetical protein